MLPVTYTGSLVEQAGTRGFGPTMVWYGASTYVTPEVVPTAEVARRVSGGGGRGAGDEEAVAEEEAVILAVVTWTVHHAR